MKDRTKKPYKKSLKRKPNPLRTDPTRMATLRREFISSLKRQFREIKRRIIKIIVTEDVFGLKGKRSKITTNKVWVAKTDPDKIKEFKEWLASTMGDTLTSKDQEEAIKKYIQSGYEKGAGRSFDDVRKSVPRVIASPTNPESGDIDDKGYSDSPNQAPNDQFYEGTKDEFLRSSFAQPVSQEKVELLASRCYDDMEGMTDDLCTKLSRTLTDGLVEGKSPYDVADDLVDTMDISQSRAETIARTELSRCHAEGQLLALEGLGVEELGVAVEWSTANDGRVCLQCQPLEGKVISIKDAHNMIPFHPNCRCAFVPANVGEEKSDKEDSAEDLKDLEDSKKEN